MLGMVPENMLTLNLRMERSGTVANVTDSYEN